MAPARPERESKPPAAMEALVRKGHVNHMKTGFLTALLLLGMLVPMTTALADGPVEEAVALATAVALCAQSAVDTGGEVGFQNGHPYQTYVDTHPACLN